MARPQSLRLLRPSAPVAGAAAVAAAVWFASASPAAFVRLRAGANVQRMQGCAASLRPSQRTLSLQVVAGVDDPIAVVADEDSVEEQGPTGQIFVCTGSQCCQDGAADTRKMLEKLAPKGVTVQSVACLGPCGSGPNILASPAPPDGVSGGRLVESKRMAGKTYPAGVVFTGIRSPTDAGLLAPWGFDAVDGGILGSLRLAVRNSQLDQVPWPILLYVGFNVVRLIVNLIFHVDLLVMAKSAIDGLRA